MTERMKVMYKAQYYCNNRSHNTINISDDGNNETTHLITAWPRLLQIIIALNTLNKV